MGIESQSRYGIMQNLNERKIQIKNELNQIESLLREQEWRFTKEYNELQRQITNEEQNYKTEHQNWKAMKKVDRKLLEQETVQKIKIIDEEIQNRDSTLEETHKRNLEILKNTAKTNKEQFDFWRRNQEELKKNKEDIIKEIENGISSLKEISKEQKEKEK